MLKSSNAALEFLNHNSQLQNTVRNLLGDTQQLLLLWLQFLPRKRWLLAALDYQASAFTNKENDYTGRIRQPYMPNRSACVVILLVGARLFRAVITITTGRQCTELDSGSCCAGYIPTQRLGSRKTQPTETTCIPCISHWILAVKRYMHMIFCGEFALSQEIFLHAQTI